jgi:hypothetical protein
MSEAPEPKMPLPLEMAFQDEVTRHIKVIRRLTERWPNFRMSFAYGLLGGAIAHVDMMGGDVEGFLAKLRATTQKPEPLVPPKSS